MPHTWIRRAPRVLALCVLAAACSSGDPAVEETTSSSPPATAEVTTTTAPRTTSRLLTDVDAVWQIDGDRGYTPEQVEIVRSYVKAEQANHIAHLHPVDPEDPHLLATTTGRHLAQVQKVFRDDQAAGIAKNEPTFLTIRTGRIVVESPTRVQIEVCYASDAHRYEVATGKLLEPDEDYAIRQVVAMNLVDDVWKLEQLGEVDSWSAIPVCLDPLSP